tara:strand:- start:100 stop:279 length:180 start_codon:yes stop_codon:yes gene_type:complete
MQLAVVALASSPWGIARFTTDTFTIFAIGILAALSIILLKGKGELKNIWTNENALSNKY